MATPRAGTPLRRTTAAPPLPAISPHAKPLISLEDWESKAPLSSLEIKSVNALKRACEEKPLPLKFTADNEQGPSSRSSTPAPTIRNKQLGGVHTPSSPTKASSSRPGTPLNPLQNRNKQHQHPLHPKQSVQTPQQFYDWYALVDRSVAHSQEAHFREHLNNVGLHLETCQQLMAQVDAVEGEVDGMISAWTSVEEGGRALKDACEKLLQERDRLLELTDAIGDRLEYFQELETATRMLNHPGESLVLQTDFLYMVERVDICIEYLREHRHFKEAELYLLRFQQCLTRAMTLIKMYFVGSLKALTNDVLRRLSEKGVSPTAQMHLLYTRFKTVSTQLGPLLRELERRAQAYPDDLNSLLGECYASYFAARKGLLVGRLMEEIKGLDPGRTELVELTRSGCSYLKQLCTDEFNLYREFFNSGEEPLYQYLENLCDYLYDDLRPRILHEPRLTVLCEVCTVLQALMVLDSADPDANADDPELSSSPTTSSRSDASESDSEADDQHLTMDFSGSRSKKGRLGGKLHISHLLQMVLQDAQTRLFFKAQAVVQAEIRYYAPKAEDLAYPEKLLVAARKQSVTAGGAVEGEGGWTKEKEAVSRVFAIPSMRKEETWYPTVRRVVWVLSQLRDFVKPAIFEDIAQETLLLCRGSITSAAENMRVKNGSPLDAQLFVVRHMLILKEIMGSLELESATATGPSSSSAGAGGGGMLPPMADALLKGTSYLLPAALFTSLGLPGTSGASSILDAKQGIDQDLKTSCEAVIAHCSDPVTQHMRSWVERVHVEKATAPKAASKPTEGGTNAPPAAASASVTHQQPFTSQEWANQTAAESLDSSFREACERDLRASVKRMRLYLEDERTVSVLVRHVQDRIADDYAGFKDVVWGLYGNAMRAKVLGREKLAELLSDVCRADQ